MKFNFGAAGEGRVAGRRGRRLPYFSVLLAHLDARDSRIETALGRHVHWGYWPHPRQATGDAVDYAAAAERMTQEVYGAAGVTDGHSVLDVGCGFGGTIASLDERFRSLQLTGLNIDVRQIERARSKVRARPGNRVGFVVGDASQLPFAAQSFDAVLAVEAIFHFPDRAQFFREASRVLKPGGRLALSDFVPAMWMQPALWLNVAASYYGHCDMRYSLHRYRRLAQATGFQVIAERNITSNTLPTFPFLKSLQSTLAGYAKAALRESALLHAMSLLGLLRYTILAFEKHR